MLMSFHVEQHATSYPVSTVLRAFHYAYPIFPSLLRGDERLEAGDGLLLDLLLHLRHHLLQWSEKEEGFSQ